MRLVHLAAVLALVPAWGCKEEKPAPPLSSLAPPPLPSLAEEGAGEDSLYRVEPAEVYGEPLPEEALRLELAGEAVRAGSERLELRQEEARGRLAERVRGRTVLVVADEDTYLAQASDLLEVLKEGAEAVWVRHPEQAVGYKVVLRNEQDFQAWLAEVAPGKLRVIQRQDGFELSTAVGKLPGADPNGPSVPVRGGKQDFGRLRKGLVKLKERFTQSEDICLVPSFGTEVAQAVRALGAVYTAPGEPLFEVLCLVYPTPVKR